jgi:hypothetical protein
VAARLTVLEGHVKLLEAQVRVCVGGGGRKGGLVVVVEGGDRF